MVHSYRCSITTIKGSPCTKTGEYVIGELELCYLHFPLVVRSVKQAMTEDSAFLRGVRNRVIKEEAQEIARLARLQSAAKIRTESADTVIYYVERDGYIKIGMTTNLEKRLKNLANGGTASPPGMTIGPVTLLASHGGGRASEKYMHRRFADLRLAGEWFRSSPELLEHIAAINDRQARNRNIMV